MISRIARKFRDSREWLPSVTAAKQLRTTTYRLRTMAKTGVLVRGRHWHKTTSFYYYRVEAIKADSKLWLKDRMKLFDSMSGPAFAQRHNDCREYEPLPVF
jgi:hypothetical protein